MMTKTGDLTENSQSDFDPKKKVVYIEKKGFYVADENNKDKLKEPVKLKEKNKYG